ncbi:dnaJ homolog subfamily C member 1 isoform X2 [Daktulosphaira vitifoliae]|uniref:dnaJ homolog subfamily C member 1 isoform X2 n=1 Tax=Daktulosphaira vitifoliae TaxID=58002 RepID=UPI0021A9F6A8|nr:dnaJ homolog subfamily C member 1 isoform X2 [Daktulosphaira vitifoliae]
MTMNSKMLAVICILLANITPSILGWETKQLEVFDTVEELNNINFYKYLDVPEDANLTTIRQSFKKMSLLLHPDRNKSPDADERFRELVAIHEVLKDPEKREYYDEVLKTGLPNWRHALYYYRRVRKLGLLEMFVILFSIISVGQYLVAWGSYVENKLTVENLLSSKVKKLRKQKKYRGDSTLPPEFDINIPKPSVKNTLPFQIPYWLWLLIINLPWLTTSTISFLITKFKERNTKEKTEEFDKPEPIIRERVRRRKTPYKLPEINSQQNNATIETHDKSSSDQNEIPAVVGGLWTDEDLYELSQLVNKYPSGTSDRWQKVAKAMNRPVPEVAYMANKMKQNNYKVPTSGEMIGSPNVEEFKKKKTRAVNNNESTDSAWNQIQQKSLESALTKYPKGSTENRWEKIAKCVPDKTKIIYELLCHYTHLIFEECMARYKEIVEMVKKKKDLTDEPLENDDIVNTE